MKKYSPNNEKSPFSLCPQQKREEAADAQLTEDASSGVEAQHDLRMEVAEANKFSKTIKYEKSRSNDTEPDDQQDQMLGSDRSCPKTPSARRLALAVLPPSPPWPPVSGRRGVSLQHFNNNNIFPIKFPIKVNKRPYLLSLFPLTFLLHLSPSSPTVGSAWRQREHGSGRGGGGEKHNDELGPVQRRQQWRATVTGAAQRAREPINGLRCALWW
uniref:Uncharacterized protein n=1 Tax=Oryza punctata TaxID=4537 RepID=A0A0E0LUN8_ORYPU